MLENWEDLHGELQECVIQFNMAYKRLSKLRDAVEDQISHAAQLLRAPDTTTQKFLSVELPRFLAKETSMPQDEYDKVLQFLRERLCG